MIVTVTTRPRYSQHASMLGRCDLTPFHECHRTAKSDWPIHCRRHDHIWNIGTFLQENDTRSFWKIEIRTFVIVNDACELPPFAYIGSLPTSHIPCKNYSHILFIYLHIRHLSYSVFLQ